MCKHLNEMELYEYLDDVLEPGEKVKVANHLSVCPECRQKIAEIKLMFYELDHLEAIEIPKELELVRLNVVSNAFEGEKVAKLKSIQKNIKNQQEKLSTSFVGRHVINQKNNVGKLGKGLWTGSKRLAKTRRKDEILEKPVKKKLSLRRLL